MRILTLIWKVIGRKMIMWRKEKGKKVEGGKNRPENRTPVAERVQRIELNSRGSGRKSSKNQGPGSSRKLQKNTKLVPGQKKILEYYSRMAKK